MKCLSYLLLLATTIVTPTHSAVPKPKGLTATIGPICLDSNLWSLPTFDVIDCQRAIQNFYSGDEASWGEEVLDFLVRGATSRTRFSKFELPVTYDYGIPARTSIHSNPVLDQTFAKRDADPGLNARAGTCTLAIAMLATVPLRYVPPIPPGTFFPESDRSTFEVLSFAAEHVKRKCVDNGGDIPTAPTTNDTNFRATLPGWMTAGSKNAIGVFFFDSRSYMRRVLVGDFKVFGTNETDYL